MMKHYKLSFFLGMMLFLFAPLTVFAQTDEDIEIESDDTLDGDEDIVREKSPFQIGYYGLGDGISFLSNTGSYSLNLSGYVQSSFQSHLKSWLKPFQPICCVWD